jgi:hypothetical protein
MSVCYWFIEVARWDHLSQESRIEERVRTGLVQGAFPFSPYGMVRTIRVIHSPALLFSLSILKGENSKFVSKFS